MRPASFITVASVVLGALSLQSCSGVRPASNGRYGLFDDLSGSRSIAQRPTGNPVIDKPRDKRVREARSAAVAATAVEELKNAGLRWPLKKVEVTSAFGHRGHDFHEGIDLRARLGTPVYAAQSGVVLYADSRIRGYGKMIVIKHHEGLATVYAHASKILVHRGQKVNVGQKIAISGKTGRATGPHLHFEIRRGVVAVNPFDILPKTRIVSADEPLPKAAPPARLAGNR